MLEAGTHQRMCSVRGDRISPLVDRLHLCTIRAGAFSVEFSPLSSAPRTVSASGAKTVCEKGPAGWACSRTWASWAGVARRRHVAGR